MNDWFGQTAECALKDGMTRPQSELLTPLEAIYPYPSLFSTENTNPAVILLTCGEVKRMRKGNLKNALMERGASTVTALFYDAMIVLRHEGLFNKCRHREMLIERIVIVSTEAPHEQRLQWWRWQLFYLQRTLQRLTSNDTVIVPGPT